MMLAGAEKSIDPKDFWLSCGHHLLDRSEGGGLIVTDAFLKAYLARPELLPPPDSCPAERTLHAALLADQRRAVEPGIVEEIADPDARENWRAMLDFRDHLLSHPTLEAAYLDLVRSGAAGATPPLFMQQLVHVILRNILDGCGDPFVLRAAEIFFRPQKLTIRDGALIAADEELVAGIGAQPASPLVAMLGPKTAEIDVLVDANAESYWERSDLFDMAIDLTGGRRGLAVLAEVIERWVAHMLGLNVTIEPLTELRNARLSWYVGLDQHGTQIGNALWGGEALDQSDQARLAGLFRLAFRDNSAAAAESEPVYLIMAMGPDLTLRLKPQNLLVGLPARNPEALA
jgi:hypothetical protein